MFKTYLSTVNYHFTRLIICLLLCFFQSLSLFAQPWQWAKSGGGFQPITSDETVRSIVTDSEGNVYFITDVSVAGLKIDGVPTSGYGDVNSVNIAIVSYNCDGDLRWSQIIGPSGGSGKYMGNLQIDDNDNIYLAGRVVRTTQSYLSSTTQLPYSTSNTEHKQNLFLLKYSNMGDLLWHVTPQPDDIDVSVAVSHCGSYGLQTDGLGNSYWLVILPPGTFADGNFQNTTTEDQFYILKYDANGQFVSGHDFEMEINGILPGYKMIRNHNTGQYYLGGYISYGGSPILLGTDSVTMPMFLISFNQNGEYLWKKENTYSGDGAITDLILDDDNNIFISGATSIEIGTYLGDTFSGVYLTSPYYGTFPFIMKLTPDGDVIWSTNGQTVNSSMRHSSIAINDNEVAITMGHGNIYWDNDSLNIVVNAGYDIMLARFNKQNGSLIDLDKIPSNSGNSDFSSALASDKFNNFYIGGRFKHFLYVNPTTTLINSADGYDYVLFKYGNNTACNCDLPTPFYTHSNVGGDVSFTYTGTTSYDHIVWDFGNGDTSIVENPSYTFTTGEDQWVCVSVTDDCGTAKYCSQISPTIGVNELLNIGVELYQNNIENYLSIQSPQHLKYSIHSILGQQIEGGEISEGENIINVFSLSQGSYILTISDDERFMRSFQFIK